MAEKEDYAREWEEVYKALEEKTKELKSFSFRLQEAGQRRINHIKNEIEEMPNKTPTKMKARDKAQKIEDDIYKIIEKAEEFSALCDIPDRGLKDLEERVQAYKSNETREQNEKGEYDE